MKSYCIIYLYYYIVQPTMTSWDRTGVTVLVILDCNLVLTIDNNIK